MVSVSMSSGSALLNMSEIKANTWEFIVLLCVTLTGWAFTAGSMYAHLGETSARLERLEQKVDIILYHEKGIERQ